MTWDEVYEQLLNSNEEKQVLKIQNALIERKYRKLAKDYNYSESLITLFVDDEIIKEGEGLIEIVQYYKDEIDTKVKKITELTREVSQLDHKLSILHTQTDEVDLEDIQDCRYGDILIGLMEELDYHSVLRLDYVDDYSGHVDMDVLLSNGRVFSYYYSYGSCSGCDDWEDKELSSTEIKMEMYKAGSTFDNIEQYREWRRNCED